MKFVSGEKIWMTENDIYPALYDNVLKENFEVDINIVKKTKLAGIKK